MKKIVLVALIGLCVLGISTVAMAYPLPDPTTIFDPSGQAAPVGGTVLASLINQSFVGKDVAGNVKFSGTYSQWVVQNTTGLAFLYQFTNGTVGPTANIFRWSTTDFGGYLTSGGFDPNITVLGNAKASIGTDPIFVGRGGDEVGWTWDNIYYLHMHTRVAPGLTSPLLWVQTNATEYTKASSSIIDGGTANVLTYGPKVVPEPSSMILLGMGLVGFVGRKLRRKFNA